MILSLPGAGHFDVLRVVNPSASLSIPPPKYDMALARSKMLVLSSDDEDSIEQPHFDNDSMVPIKGKKLCSSEIFDPSPISLNLRSRYPFS